MAYQKKTEQTLDQTLPESKEFFKIVQHVSKVTFHSNDINIDGKMSDTFYKEKIKSIKELGWTQTGSFMIRANKCHIFGAASVKDSVLE